MSLPIPDRIETLAALDEATNRYCSLLRGTSKGDAPAIGRWNVRDVAVHTAHIFDVLSKAPRGGVSPVTDHRAMSETWERLVREDAEHDLSASADRIEAAAVDLAKGSTADTWETLRPWHGELQIPEYGLACIMVNEAVVHGLDIARATSIPWEIRRPDALIAIYGLLPVLGHFLRPETTKDMQAVYRLKLRGGATLYLKVDNGTLTIDEEPLGRVDCTISADPASYLLVGYGRKSQWGPIATGRIAAWGRNPSLALKFGKLFVTP